MDNPNPIYYRDLITPDNSITELIAQLEQLIAEYDKAKSKIQGAAQQAAQSMSNLSGATEEQRQQISLLTTESDKLAAAYKQTTDAERQAYRDKQKVLQAEKEQQQIDKLVVQLNNSKEGSYNRLSAQYRLNKIRLNEMSAAERSGTEAGRQLETETRKIYEEMSRLQKATGKYTLEVGHYQNATTLLRGPLGMAVNAFTAMGRSINQVATTSLPAATKAVEIFKVALLGIIAVLLALGRAMVNSFRTMNNFEQANVNLSTILGVTREQMSMLTDSALSLARATEYTASEVTQLQTELAKLGFRQTEIINMTKYVLQFATAVGANLGEAAEVAGSTLRAFGLSSRDTEDALGTLAVATNNSALSFSKIRESIGTVFPVANAFGISLKDTTALLGALANAGFDASSAATATRNILLKLADANGALAKQLGGNVRTFDGFIDGLIKLRDAGVDLNTALELTDRRSVSAFSAFLKGAESARELRESLEDVSGELERIQQTRLETVSGQISILKSAWESFILSMSDSRGVISDVLGLLTKLINSATDKLAPGQRFRDYYTEEYLKIFREAGEKGVDVAAGYQRTMAELINITNSRAFTPGAKKLKRDAEAMIEGLKRAYMMYNDEVAAANQQRAEAEAQAQEKQNEETEKERKKRIAAEKRAVAEAKRAASEKNRATLDALKSVEESINNEIAITEKGTEQMLDLRIKKVEAARQIELEQNRQKAETARIDEAIINAKYDKQAIEATKAFYKEVSQIRVQNLQAEQQSLQLQIEITKENTQDRLDLQMEMLDKQMLIELEQNKQKEEQFQLDDIAIIEKYNAKKLRLEADFNIKLAKRDLAAAQDLAQAEFNLTDKNERQKTLFKLQQEKARLEATLKLNETATEKMTATEVAAVKATIAGIEKEIKRLPYDNLFELFGIGVDSDQQDALKTAIDSVKDSIESLVDSWNAAAEAAVNAADKQVEAAQKTLDAEIEARNAGYANEVVTAQKELALAKKNQEQALKEKQKAQKAQLAIDTITQASSLVTASANIWSALGGIPYVGPALAIAAIATMWGTFAAAKIKAAQVTQQSEQYGEGTVELLEGGSHASGNDIDLGTKKDGTRRRAEGGEYFAIINKRNSRRYRDVIPDVINSFNDGTFADRYQKANAAMAGLAVTMIGGATDVTSLERDVSAIRKQGDQMRYVDGHGNTIMRYKNLTRKILS